MTSPNLVPFCLAPEMRKKGNAERQTNQKKPVYVIELRLTHSASVWRLIVIALTQVKVVGVEHELGQVEKLGDEFLDVGHVVFGGGEPGLAHAVEHPVGQVKVTPLVVT